MGCRYQGMETEQHEEWEEAASVVEGTGYTESVTEHDGMLMRFSRRTCWGRLSRSKGAGKKAASPPLVVMSVLPCLD